MTQTESDIALLLADATDEVEIGIAPVQAVIHGGRRRRARRWAVATATAVAVLAGSVGATLAVTGVPDGGHGDRRTNVAKPPASAEARHVYEPQRTQLSRGSSQGEAWSVDVQVWGAPRNESEADRQFDTMAERGLKPAGVHKPADLIGKISYFATRSWGEDRPQQLMYNTVRTLESFSGTDLEAFATRFSPDDAKSERLVIGEVAKTVQEVTCRWKDGTAGVARLTVGFSAHDHPNAIRAVDGYPTANWFVCLAPQGTAYKLAEVTAK